METSEKNQKWVLDPSHSEIEFAVRHMMISPVKGHFTKFNLVATGNRENPEKGSVEVHIETKSIETRENDRDNHLKSQDFFHVEKFPEIVFKSTSIKSLGENEFSVKGNMTIKDVTKEIVFHMLLDGVIKDPYGKTRAGLTVEGELNREDFGLTWNMIIESGKVMVGNKIKLSGRFEIIKQE